MTRCPVCGGALDRQEATKGLLTIPAQFVRGKSQLEVVLQPCVVSACTECEYVEDRCPR